MDSGSNKLYKTFPNVFSLLLADPAHLLHIQKPFFQKKSWTFDRESALDARNLLQWGQHVIPESASTFPTNPQIWFLDSGT